MEIFVFSYNRGRYLRNCLASILKHAPNFNVTIFDDSSTDPDVMNVLHEYKNLYRVIQNESPDRNHYVGGLYSNMNKALQVSNSSLALFIQDDIQLVRDINNDDLNHVKIFFETYPDSVVFQPTFFKGRQRAKQKEIIEVDAKVPIYFRHPEGKGSIYFSAVGIMNIEKLNRADFTFSGYESENDARLGQMCSRMGISPYPFMMWLPFTESSKFRKKGILQKYAEWKTGAGFYPYYSMEPQEVKSLLSRDINQLTYAEDWLTPAGLSIPDFWNFKDASNLVPIAKKIIKFRKKLGKIGIK